MHDSIVGAPRTRAQARGQAAEAIAERHLCAQGLRILARNVRCRGGEVDLIAQAGDTVVFVEVRLRSNSRFGGAAASITAHKQRRIILAARWWLAGAGRSFAHHPCRFDAVLLHDREGAQLEWLPAAFECV